MTNHSFGFLLLSLVGCFPMFSCNQDTSPNDAEQEDYLEKSSVLFSIDALMQVAIDMDSESWDTLRYQPPNFEHFVDPDCPNGPRPQPYSWFTATASVNGEDFGQIEVRKKGLRGSMEPMKPSLKLRFRPDDIPWGVRRMTLNNAITDWSSARECLTYYLFRKAGLVAPRCGLAKVSINGHDLGIYVQIEEIRGPLLDNRFGDSKGDLYEITAADFIPEMIVMFEPKRDETSLDLSHLEAVARALKAKDADLFEELEKNLDLEWFFDYWAMEVITAHWDGYSGNRNNSFIYRNSDDGLFRFIPWGTDSSWETPKDPWGPRLGRQESEQRPRSDSRAVYAHGAIARRLYEHSQGRKRYEERLRDLLDTVWNKKELTEMVDTIIKTISPDETLARRTDPAAKELKSFIGTHKSLILEELDAGLTEWNLPPNPPGCAEATGKAKTPTVFEGTLNTLLFVDEAAVIDPFNPDLCDGHVTETTKGEQSEWQLVCGVVEYQETYLGWRNVRFNIAFAFSPTGELSDVTEVRDLEVWIPEELFYSGSSIPLNLGAGRSKFYWVDPATILDSQPKTVEIGTVATGELTLGNVDATKGGRVELSFKAPLVKLKAP
ncbi:MAG: CotH kinase family protein [Deltaproteobacteria bacterium]|nr:CotH kinase family protein [Deltaproteobacteria bacterium]